MMMVTRTSTTTKTPRNVDAKAAKEQDLAQQKKRAPAPLVVNTRSALLASVIGDGSEIDDGNEVAEAGVRMFDAASAGRPLTPETQYERVIEREPAIGAFERFVRALESPPLQAIHKEVKLFLASHKLLCSERERERPVTQAAQRAAFAQELDQRIAGFLQRMDEAIASHPAYRDASEETLAAMRDGMEKYVLCKVHDQVFAQNPFEVSRGRQLEARLGMLRKELTADSLDVPLACRSEMMLALVQEELRAMSQYPAPADKLRCVVRACSIVANALSRTSRIAAAAWARPRAPQQESARASAAAPPPPPGLGADDFMPAFFFAVLHAEIPSLWSNMEYIRKFRSPTCLKMSHAGYCFVSLQAAVEYFDAHARSGDLSAA